MKIIVVDDDTYLREIVTLNLELDHHNVLEASDGLQGLEIIQKERPDLIITDMNMPYLNGDKMIEQLKHNDSVLALIPCILISGNLDETEHKRLLNNGVDLCLKKPVSMSLLRANVNAALKRSRQHYEFTLGKIETIDKTLSGSFRDVFPKNSSLTQNIDDYVSSVCEEINSRINDQEGKSIEGFTSSAIKLLYINYAIDTVERVRQINRSENAEMLGWWLILTVTEALYSGRLIYVSDLYSSGLGSKSTIILRIQLMVDNLIFCKSPSSNDSRRQSITLTESFSTDMDEHIHNSIVLFRSLSPP